MTAYKQDYYRADRARWLADHPQDLAAALDKHGVEPWRHPDADAHNRVVIAAAKEGYTHEQLAVVAEESFRRRFGTALAEVAIKSEYANAGGGAVTHVSLGPSDQVAIANSIGELIQEYYERKVV